MLASWLESLSEMFDREPGALVACVVALGVFVLLAVAVIAVQQRETQRTKIEAELKRDMLERGLPPEEIERLSKATSRTSRKGLLERLISTTTRENSDDKGA